MSGFRAPLRQFVSQRARRSDDPRFVPPVVIGSGLDGALDELKARLREATEQVDAARVQNNNQQEQIDALLTLVKRLTDDSEEGEYGSCDMEINQVNEEVERLRLQSEEDKARLDEYRVDRLKLKEQIRELEEDRTYDNERLQEYGKSAARLGEKQEELLKEIAAKNNAIAMLKAQLEAAFTRLNTGGLKRKAQRVRPREGKRPREGNTDMVSLSESGAGGGGGGAPSSIPADEKMPQAILNRPTGRASVNPITGKPLGKKQGYDSTDVVKLTPLKVPSIHKFSKLKI